MGTPETTTAPAVTQTPSPKVDFKKRYKDLQEYTTNIAQENARLRSAAKAGTDAAIDLAKPFITPEVQAKLDIMLNDNPEAWRAEMNRMDAEAKQTVEKTIADNTATLSVEQELARRSTVLDNFLKDPNTVLTSDRMGDIPVKLIEQLEAKTINYETFLTKADEAVKGTTVATPSTPSQQPNLNTVPGSTEPDTITQAQLDQEAQETIY